ncbi:TIGR02680 family protein [Lysinibacillus sp. BF-4]|uniref:TIGR02680 family protein n=1 Tax=Lysinibacillus sp. BF-4 TaxID=1473546 RepID=UPI000569CA09|nr:TIGR02680 family protein [Lysinibacillus sp. BF-4]
MTQWQINRAGLLSFWYYDEEIFEFADGKLLLRGTNGSGKSVTMQSFIPVLLDGKKSPDRLDPFGSKARKMSDYLLGEEGVSNREERTGYLFIEYKMLGTEQYITTGIGMQARRHKDLKSWYFVITDNRRIGIDFELAHRSEKELIPFSQKELTNRISTGGIVTDSQKEYAALVNKYIFGFETMEAYEDLVKLLIQLRAPKLSKDFKPTVLYDILTSALPPITDDELSHLSDVIENMDQTEQQLEQLTLEYKANKKIVERYDVYNKYILGECAERVMLAEDELSNYSSCKKDLVEEMESREQYIKRLNQELEQTRLTLKILNNEEQSLNNHEIWAITTKLEENKQHLMKVQQKLTKLQMRKDKENTNYLKHEQAIKQQEEKLIQIEYEKQELLLNMQLLAEETDFTQHVINVESYDKGTPYFDYWKKEVSAHKEKIRNIASLVATQESLHEQEKVSEQAYSVITSELDIGQTQLVQSEHWYREEQHKLKMALSNWMDNHDTLHFTVEEQQKASSIIERLYEGTIYSEATAILTRSLNKLRAEKMANLATNEQSQLHLKTEIIKEQQHLQQLKATKLAEPQREEGKIAFRKQLTAQGVPYVPFYAAVEFQSHVTEQQKGYIEDALLTTGILDSLISPNHFTVQEDAVLLSNPKLLDFTLADFLQPDVEDKSVPIALIDEILRSIPVETTINEFAIDVKGFYRMGLIKGHAPSHGPARFIGRTSRKRYQEEQILRKKQLIEQLNEQLQATIVSHSLLSEKLEEIASWESTIPTDKTLNDLRMEIYTQQESQKNRQFQQQEIEQKWQDIRGQLKKIQQQLNLEENMQNIPKNTEQLKEVAQAHDEYLAQLNDLHRIFDKIKVTKNRLQEIEQQVENSKEMIDDIHSEIIDEQYAEKAFEQEIHAQEYQLKLQGAEDVQQRIAEVQQEKQINEIRFEEIRTICPKEETEYEYMKDKLQQLEQQEYFANLMFLQWQQALQEELNFKFIPVENTCPKALTKQFKKNQDRVKLEESLSRVINEQLTVLAEYNSKSYINKSKLLPQLEVVNHEKIENFERLRNRRIIELEYRGQYVSPYHIDNVLQSELTYNHQLLDEQDRELYEDIIVNSVGRILRQRIARAQQWVKEMDSIMAVRDNSSGLIFSVSWKPRTAEAEGELDTKELVQLLQRKSSFLSEVDLKKITKHFRSRIESAKEIVSLRNEGNTLRQVLKEVLDYRKWFSFILYYTRQNETKKELTNNAFYKFSGGEKAMAMYIPLFTAAYSRYKEADTMAPFIISLDEAFAGVDEQNIRDMFEVVEQLGFNYIMNSQAIWGDYDTVSNLAIAELIRPKNADYVTVLNYRWNGKERELID